MLVTLSGIVILLRLVQFWKARVPMLVTLSGIVILVRLVHSAKASELTEVTTNPSIVSGITNAPDADSSQSVIVTEVSSLEYVRSSKLAAWRGRTAQAKSARRA